MSTYPVTFEMDYVEPRSRLTTFFRWLLVIPHLIVLTLWSIVAGLAVLAAWFALVFTARYPQGLYDFVAGFLRYSTRVTGYAYLGVDPYPPFTGGEEHAYPARLNIAPPLERYSRLKAGFRFILAIPIALIVYAMQIVYQVGAFLAWFAILILGRQPKGLQDMIALGVSYQQRAYAYFAHHRGLAAVHRSPHRAGRARGDLRGAAGKRAARRGRDAAAHAGGGGRARRAGRAAGGGRPARRAALPAGGGRPARRAALPTGGGRPARRAARPAGRRADPRDRAAAPPRRPDARRARRGAADRAAVTSLGPSSDPTGGERPATRG